MKTRDFYWGLIGFNVGTLFYAQTTLAIVCAVIAIVASLIGIWGLNHRGTYNK